MVIDGACQQPVSRVVSCHFSCRARSREKTDGVCMVVQSGQDLTMEMNWMDVHLQINTISTLDREAYLV